MTEYRLTLVDLQTPNTPDQANAARGQEGNLDAELILGIGHPLPMTTFNTGGDPPPFTPNLAMHHGKFRPPVIYLPVWLIELASNQRRSTNPTWPFSMPYLPKRILLR